ncbi:MAG: urease accessory protein UreD [Methylomonas sp.]|jgi:urease accessory protein|uniref:urease accessory protein UreD n=1 Tax=Methylomonas sp. TaxID=418 RepID=UPI0025F6B41D|nr:urease accessory protein UreD [Methylomonas sp.]MCK9604838.1 urease accessory protein UreD [Methylomonas sp.]
MRPDSPAAGLADPSDIGDSAWQAELNLGFARRGDKTVLARRAHRGPLTVQRPFYPEGPVCHVYLLHPPGGVVAGDRLHFDISVDNAGQALITTPAAGKFYRSGGGRAQQTVQLRVAENASLEWLPQESIVYEGASLHTGMEIELADGAGFIGWEVLALGRPAAGEGFDAGQAVLNWRIKRGGRLFYLEKQRLDTAAFKSRWGLHSHSACGTLFACSTRPHHLQAVQALIGDDPSRGVTQIEDMLICRALDDRADRLRQFYMQVWALLRTDIVGQNSCPPRIWAT